MWVPSPGQDDALEKGMATHSSILAWRIPDRGARRPQSMGSHRVGYDWSDLACTHVPVVNSLGLTFYFVLDFSQLTVFW